MDGESVVVVVPVIVVIGSGEAFSSEFGTRCQDDETSLMEDDSAIPAIPVVVVVVMVAMGIWVMDG